MAGAICWNTQKGSKEDYCERKLFRTQFDQLETTEKQALMESLAARYDMVFLGLHTFDR